MKIIEFSCVHCLPKRTTRAILMVIIVWCMVEPCLCNVPTYATLLFAIAHSFLFSRIICSACANFQLRVASYTMHFSICLKFFNILQKNKTVIDSAVEHRIIDIYMAKLIFVFLLLLFVSFLSCVYFQGLYLYCKEMQHMFSHLILYTI